MNISRKNLLEKSNILYLSPSDKICKTSVPILKLFFNKIIYSDTIDNALKKINNGIIDILVSEIDFYNSSGINFIKTIRKINNNIPIIIITNNKKTNILIEAIKLNITEYIIKPTDVNILIKALNESSKILLNNGDIINKINNNLYYNYLDKTIKYKESENKLTKNEAKLFELLISKKDKIIKIEDIKKYMWANKELSESAMKTLFNRLSKKVGKETITNSFGVGYGIYSE